MTLRAVDLFAGFGGFTCGASMAGAEVVWAANHWQTAVDVHSLNHPTTHHVCQDLRQANWRALPSFDVLLASPACVPGDALVTLASGSLVKADSIRLGDSVLTHMGRGQEVTNIWCRKYSGQMCELLIWGDTKQCVRMTGEHQVWIRRRGGHLGRLGAPRFVRACDVRQGDYVAFPRVSPTIGSAARFVHEAVPSTVTYDAPSASVAAFKKSRCSVRGHVRAAHKSTAPGAKCVIAADATDLWWLLGQYIGDGQSRRDRSQIGWSVGGSAENLDRVKRALVGMGLRYWVRGPSSNATVFASSKHLSALCGKFGRLAHEKRIPEPVLCLEPENAAALIDGYLDADGCERKGRAVQSWEATSTSLELLQGIQQLCWRLGWSASIAIGDYARKATIQGRQVNCRASWTINITKKPHSQSRTKFEGEHVWRSVRKVILSACVDVPVFDFEVAEDHTFCLPGVIVHNCQGHSSASVPNPTPKHDDDRGTAWAVVDCVEANRPKALVVENVPKFLKWPLYPTWKQALEVLGYTLTEQLMSATAHGVPQRRTRLFVIGTLNGKRVEVPPTTNVELPFASCLSRLRSGWRRNTTSKPGAQDRIRRAQSISGSRCLVQHVTGHPGVPLSEPIRTITTKPQWILVDGDHHRWLTPRELARGQSFPDSFRWPAMSNEDATRGIGNAVPPRLARDVVAAVVRAVA